MSSLLRYIRTASIGPASIKNRKRCSMQGRTILIDRRPKGHFSGMNWYAARSLRVPFPYGRNDIIIVGSLPKADRERVMMHERIESAYMKQGVSYRVAHAQTLLDMGDSKDVKEALKDADRNLKAARK